MLKILHVVLKLSVLMLFMQPVHATEAFEKYEKPTKTPPKIQSGNVAPLAPVLPNLLAAPLLPGLPGLLLSSPVLVHQEWLPFLAHGYDNNYVYGGRWGQPSSRLFRINSTFNYIDPNRLVSDQALFDFNNKNMISPVGRRYDEIDMVYATKGILENRKSLLFALVSDQAVNDDDTTKHSDLFKSIDGGLNWGSNPPKYDNYLPVYHIGLNEKTGIQTPFSLNLSDRTFTEDKKHNQLLLVNYLPNDGPARLVKSKDKGTTWQEIAAWNTECDITIPDPNQVKCQIRHLHFVRNDPYTGYNYIGSGDDDNTSGIIVWNGVSPLTSNKPISAVNYPGSMGGSQKFRAVDMLFTPQYIYWVPDTDQTQNIRGIWRASKLQSGAINWNSAQLINTDIANYPYHSGGLGLIHSKGNMFFTEILEHNSDQMMNLYVSDTNGLNWKIITQQRWNNFGATTINGNFFEWKNYLFFPGSRLGGKVKIGTNIVNLQQFSTQSAPNIIAPVYYVDTVTGTDAVRNHNDVENDGINYGWSRKIPWKTEGFALEHIDNNSWVIVTENGIVVRQIKKDGNGAVIYINP